MRLILGISLMLVGIGMLSCRVEGLAARRPEPPVASQWVRTVDGWERTDSWHIVPVRGPQVHPLVVAAGQGLASVFALVAFGREARGGPVLARRGVVVSMCGVGRPAHNP